MERMLGAAGRGRPPASKRRHREPIRPGKRGVAQSGRLPLEPISRKRSAKTATIIVVRPCHTENPAPAYENRDAASVSGLSSPAFFGLLRKVVEGGRNSNISRMPSGSVILAALTRRLRPVAF